MSTRQSYDAKNASQATIVSAVETDQPPLVTSDDRQGYQTSGKPWTDYYLDYLNGGGYLTPDQRSEALLIYVPDESMVYPLLSTTEICVVRLKPQDYHTATRVVVIDLTDGTTVIGRMASLTNTEIVITRDNPEWPTLTVPRDQILDFYKATHFTSCEVL